KEDIKIDKSLYIRSRLFDNIIGDWDRHQDQWRWARKKDLNGGVIYLPIPRDRDQTYSNFDGIMLGLTTAFNPTLRFMQLYNDKYKSVRWFNDAGDDVDFAVLKDDTLDDWIQEAAY